MRTFTEGAAAQHVAELVEVLAYFLPAIERQVSQELSDGGVGMDEDIRLSRKARDLLVRLQPSPPTLAETLAALDRVMTPPTLAESKRARQAMCEDARALLDRARRAGLL